MHIISITVVVTLTLSCLLPRFTHAVEDEPVSLGVPDQDARTYGCGSLRMHVSVWVRCRGWSTRHTFGRFTLRLLFVAIFT